MAQLYQYDAIDPKDEFRLLLLKAGTDGDALRADIIQASFGDDIKYVALSYAWGPDIKTKQLITPQGVLPITDSLASALKCLRSRDEDVLLWADAACINQSDNQEKNHQVRRIRDIYAGAEVVRVHLGDEGDDSELVAVLVETLNTIYITTTNNTGSNLAHELDKKVGVNVDGLLLPESDPAWRALRAILRRPWFRRVWVVQEFTVARDVIFHCGSHTVAWLKLYNALLQCGALQFPLRLGPEEEMLPQIGHQSFRCLVWNRMAYQQDGKRPLLELLVLFKGSLASRARDNMFAMLGIAEDADGVEFDADYDEPLVRVVCRYAAALVRLGHGPQLLSLAGVMADTPEGFPSWAPDWTASRKAFRLVCWEKPGEAMFYAGGNTKLDMTVSTDQTTVKMTCSFFDKIIKVGMSYTEHPGSTSSWTSFNARPFIDQLKEAETMASNLSVYPTGDTVQTAFQIVALGGHGGPAARAFVLDQDPIHMELPQNLHNNACRKKIAATWNIIGKIYQLFMFMRFCITEKGYIGMCTNNAKAGDLVYILHGMHTPYTMRRTAGRDDEHLRLVGQCYIHGIMDGEALTLPGYEPRDIYIC